MCVCVYHPAPPINTYPEGPDFTMQHREGNTIRTADRVFQIERLAQGEWGGGSRVDGLFFFFFFLICIKFFFRKMG